MKNFSLWYNAFANGKADMQSSFASGGIMARTVGIGIQDFGKIIERNCFYVDRTAFIKEWWESQDEVTLITRPRRFGMTLNMSMVERLTWK